MMAETCKGPSALQTPQNQGKGMGQWIRKEHTRSEIRSSDSSPFCHQWGCDLGQVLSSLQASVSSFTR